jgi:hypothetical protein
VAIRPLCVEELAELLAYDFDTTEEGIPIVNPNWRWEDHEEAVLSTCSSLIAVVSDGDSRVVQFSHFSVKEFLTSNRLASSGGDVTHHCISLEFAHTLFAQACLGTLLSLDDKAGGSGSVGSGSGNFPLAGYAAQHWMAHARIDKVSSRVKTGMQQLFDPTKPQFSAWIQLYNVDVQFWKSWYRTRGAKGLITMLQRVQNDMVKVVTGSFHTASREALLQLTWMLPMRHFVEKLTYTSAL